MIYLRICEPRFYYNSVMIYTCIKVFFGKAKEYYERKSGGMLVRERETERERERARDIERETLTERERERDRERERERERERKRERDKKTKDRNKSCSQDFFHT